MALTGTALAGTFSPMQIQRTMHDTLQVRLQARLGDGYRVARELTGGGMARLFVADEVALGRRVVVKVLTHELATGMGLERFHREVQTLSRLQHPNIVPVLTVGELDGQPYFTMPYVEGESLRVAISRTGRLPIETVIGILRDVTAALAYAHEQGVIHRDIKPDNVLLSGGIAMVTDFGVSKAILASGGLVAGSVLTSIGVVVGTPAYMAPEQAAGDPNLDDRADVYALGAMAYELLSGDTPFGERTPHSLLAAHISEKAVPLLAKRPDVPYRLADLVMKCLNKDRSDRPRSAKEVLIQLSASSIKAKSWRQRAHLTRRAAVVGGIVVAAIVSVTLWSRGRVSSRKGDAPSREFWDMSGAVLTTDERIKEAIAYYGSQRFEAVRAMLEPIVSPNYIQAVSSEQRLTAFKYLGIMHAVAGKSDSATMFLMAAIDLDPFFELDPAQFGAKELDAFFVAKSRAFKVGVKPLTDMVVRSRVGGDAWPFVRVATSQPTQLAIEVVSRRDTAVRAFVYKGRSEGLRLVAWNGRIGNSLVGEGDFMIRVSGTSLSPEFSRVTRTSEHYFRVRFGTDSTGSPITRLSTIGKP